MTAPAKPAKKPRRKFDLAEMERDYTATTLSLTMIGQKHDTRPDRVRTTAERKGWVRPAGAPEDKRGAPPSAWAKESWGQSVFGSTGQGTGGPALAGRGESPFAGKSAISAARPGNPGYDRKPTPRSIERREVAERMTSILLSIADDANLPPHARIAAAVAVQNRVQGMPRASIDVNRDDPEKISDDDLASIAAGSG